MKVCKLASGPLKGTAGMSLKFTFKLWTNLVIAVAE